MTTQNVELLLVQANEALKNGDIQRARGLVKDALALDQHNAQAWLLATHLTNDSRQQRKFIDNAKKIAPDDIDVRRRERQLFPPVAKGVFTPDPVQPQPQPTATNAPPLPRGTAHPVSDHIPTLADAVNYRRIYRPLAYIPLAAMGVCIVFFGLVVVVFGSVVQNQLDNSPSAIVLRFYPAVKAKDNTVLANLLDDEPKALCGSDLASCFRVPIDQFDSYSITTSILSSDRQSATVSLVVHYKGNAEDHCQNFLVVNNGSGWRIRKDMGIGLVPCSVLAASLATPIGQPAQRSTGSGEIAQATQFAAQTAIQATAFGSLGGINQTLAAGEETRDAALAMQAAHATQTAVVPTQTAMAVQNKLDQILKIGQIWQGEAIENATDHYPMTLKLLQISGSGVVFEINWTSFKNTTTRAEGTSIIDWTNASDIDSWKKIGAFDPSKGQVGIRFTEKAFVQGNGVKLGLTYYAVTSDGKNITGMWNALGTQGVFTLTRSN